MEPTIPNLSSVPIPTQEVSQENKFKKSKLILVLAGIQLFVSFFAIFQFSGNGFFSAIYPLSVVPAIIVIFTKNIKFYKVAKILLIIEYIIFMIIVALLIYLLSAIIGWH